MDDNFCAISRNTADGILVFDTIADGLQSFAIYFISIDLTVSYTSCLHVHCCYYSYRKSVYPK